MTRDAWADAVANMSRKPPADVLELWTERAAIREYEGGQSRDEAEREARHDVERMLLS